MQFGFIVFFSNIFPYSAVTFLIVNYFRILWFPDELQSRRRELPMIYFGIGIYTDLIDWISYLAFLVNLLYAYLNSESCQILLQQFMFRHFGVNNQSIYIDVLVIFILAEHLFIFFKLGVKIYIQNVVVIIDGKNPNERNYTRD
jgi:hypothetical protein